MRYEDLDDHEVWALMRVLGKAIRNGTYRPGPVRKCSIPKGPGRGDRILTLQNIEDRVVQRAAVEIIQPLLDPLFDNHSAGYRPQRDRCHALAQAEDYFVQQRLQVWAADDIRDAFDHVPLQRLTQVVRKYLPADDLVGLVECVLDNGTKHGLRQGGSLSPLLLNLYLHHGLDRPWRVRHRDVPLLRVADDLLLLCGTKRQAQEVHAELQNMAMSLGMPIKGSAETAIRDLKHGETVDWLGFVLRGDRTTLEVRVGEQAWYHLGEHLVLAHTMADAPLRAIAIIEGWVSQMGPCYPFEEHADTYDRIASCAHEQAFDEIPSRSELQKAWQ